MGRSGGSPGEELLLAERDCAPGGCTHRERAGPIGFMTVNVDFTFHGWKGGSLSLQFMWATVLALVGLSSRRALSSTSINNPIGFRDSSLEVLD